MDVVFLFFCIESRNFWRGSIINIMKLEEILNKISSAKKTSIRKNKTLCF